MPRYLRYLNFVYHVGTVSKDSSITVPFVGKKFDQSPLSNLFDWFSNLSEVNGRFSPSLSRSKLNIVLPSGLFRGL